MRKLAYHSLLLASLLAPHLKAQESSPAMMMQQPTPRVMAAEPATTNTVMRTNSMEVLDNRKRLGPNDFVSFRVVEDRDNESQRLRVNENGQIEVPYVGLVQAAGRTSKEIAYAVKALLEREYYYNATVIVAVDHISERSRGKVYVIGSVRGPGPQEIPPDEEYTVSKAIIRAGGFGDFADKKKVKVTRKNGQAFVVNLKDVIERGRSEGDVVVQPDDQIYVPQKLVNF
jgi:protein involved in polysaccharide export with SLBB domain